MDLAEENSSNIKTPADQDTLQHLQGQHTLLEEQISELEGLRFPTDSEETQIKQLKREKLAIKEKIERYLIQEN